MPEPAAAPRAVVIAAVAVMAFGVVVRLLGTFSLELWSDEARWCGHLLEGTGTWFRPVGYMWLTGAIVRAFEVNEPLLRSLSTIAGIAQLPLSYVLLRFCAQRPAVAVAGVWLFAIHPVAVAMSKEFKPYALESMLHSALIAFTLLHLRDKGSRWLAAVLVTAVVAPFFAWTVVFAYPGIFLLLGVHALRERRMRHFIATTAACVATLAILLVTFFARLSAKKPATETWGAKYDVFYVGDGGVLGQIAWWVQKTADIASFPAMLRMSWPPSVLVAVKVVAVALCIVGVIAIVVRRQSVLATLLLLPWLPLLVFNAAGAWPYDAFRTNTFLLVYTVALVVVGADFAAERAMRVAAGRSPSTTAAARRTMAGLGVLALLVTAPYELASFAHKGGGTMTSEASVLAALRRIYEVETQQPFAAPIDDDVRADRAARARAAHAAAARAAPSIAAGIPRGAHDSPSTIGAAGLDAGDGRVVDDDGAPRALLVLSGHACMLTRYYRDYDADSSVVLHDWLPAQFTTLCGTYTLKPWKRTLSAVRGRSFWLISAKGGWDEHTRKLLAPHCDVVHDEVFPPWTHLYRCRARVASDAAASGTVDNATDEAAPDTELQ